MQSSVIKNEDKRLRRAGGSLLESKDFEKDLGFFLDKHLKMKSLCNSVAKRPMQSWDVKKSNIKQIRGFDVARVHNSGKATVRNCVQFWCAQFKSNVEILRQVQRKGMKKDSENKRDNTRHKQLSLFNSSGKKLRSDSVTAGRDWPMEKISKSE